ncbi:Gfo/Idh/MocA family protein [Nitrosopumilus maritimus]|uniref:Oxidoreductase domain protein n=1 Tax=Nitrosopumilus maritimus (strain SCM1) TaxID=436308 RepID=A9A1T0_NITMS|nr:Gfo/Idh/MocA family oxidoreductase [Nitrosopumilus maritimus]ABX12051.1 oxidoreductase domain protein [Nitrosopumilus maritimus SCM1]
MQILVVGLGSMGKRRIRCLQKLGLKNIIGFDPRQDRRDESEKLYKISTVPTINDGLKLNPKCMIISTPPDLHYKYALVAMKNKIHFFTEVNLSSNDVQKIIKKLNGLSILGLPSNTLIYHPLIKKLKTLISKNQIGKTLTVYHHFGHYLPNWHPWEDYRDFYVSKRQTGAAREIVPFELVWLSYIFSSIKSVYGSIHKVSSLKTDIDDLYQAIIEFSNGIQCILVIDVISDPAFSETKIIGEKGVILCNHNEGILKIGKSSKWKTTKIESGEVAKGYKGNTPSESLYVAEIKNFLDSIKQKKKPNYTFVEELRILKVLDAIELSNRKSKKIVIKK